MGLKHRLDLFTKKRKERKSSFPSGASFTTYVCALFGWPPFRWRASSCRLVLACLNVKGAIFKKVLKPLVFYQLDSPSLGRRRIGGASYPFRVRVLPFSAHLLGCLPVRCFFPLRGVIII